jgi:hypothetical protein
VAPTVTQDIYFSTGNDLFKRITFQRTRLTLWDPKFNRTGAGSAKEDLVLEPAGVARLSLRAERNILTRSMATQADAKEMKRMRTWRIASIGWRVFARFSVTCSPNTRTIATENAGPVWLLSRSSEHGELFAQSV